MTLARTGKQFIHMVTSCGNKKGVLALYWLPSPQRCALVNLIFLPATVVYIKYHTLLLIYDRRQKARNCLILTFKNRTILSALSNHLLLFFYLRKRSFISICFLWRKVKEQQEMLQENIIPHQYLSDLYLILSTKK